MDYGVVAAALIPHPPIVIPAVGGAEAERVSRTRESVHDVARRLKEMRPDCVLLIDPHGPVGYGEVPLIRGQRARGDLAQFRAPSAAVQWEIDVDMTEKIAGETKETGSPARISDAKTRDFLSHGAVVPLYLLQEAGFTAPLIYAGMPLLDRDNLLAFGRLVARLADTEKKRVAVIASGDLSHRLSRQAPSGYHPDGSKFDRSIVDLLGAGDAGGLCALPETLVENAGQCGYNPLLIALGALDDSTPSGEVLSYEGPFGVGYAVALLFPSVADEEAKGGMGPVQLARAAIEGYLAHRSVMQPPDDVQPQLRERAGAFVTLRRGDQLRGCIGTMQPTRFSLAEEIIHNAIRAATRDPRFPPIDRGELLDLDISVDVLGSAEPVEEWDELDPSRYGIIVSHGDRRGLLLPDLEGIDTPDRQVEVACRKAGLSPDDPALRIERFEVTRYAES